MPFSSATEQVFGALVRSGLFVRSVADAPFFRGTHALEIHSLEKRMMEEFDINRWFRIKTARTPMGRDEILFVEIDINTQPEKPRDFGKEEITAFCLNSIEFAKKNFLNCFGVSL